MVRVVVERVALEKAGLVGGMVNSTLQVSAAIGVALIGGLFFAILGLRTDPQSIAYAFAIALSAVAVCHIGGALLAVGLGQRRQAEAPAAMAQSARKACAAGRSGSDLKRGGRQRLAGRFETQGRREAVVAHSGQVTDRVILSAMAIAQQALPARQISRTWRWSEPSF
jgi:hypothetical protein